MWFLFLVIFLNGRNDLVLLHQNKILNWAGTNKEQVLSEVVIFLMVWLYFKQRVIIIITRNYKE